jgi:hypothetical protein
MPLPGGALVGEPEVPDLAVDHEEDLDVLAADVADDVDVAAVLHGGHHVGDGLDDVDVGAQRLLEHVGRVAGAAEADHLERRALVVDERLDLGEQLLGVGDRVALGELVLLGQQVAVFVDRTALDDVEPPSRPMTPRNRLALLERRVTNLGIVYSERNVSSWPRRRRAAGPAFAPSLALRPWAMNSLRGSRPR